MRRPSAPPTTRTEPQATFDFDGVTFSLTGSSTGNLAASHLVVTVNTDNSGEPASSPLYTLTSATTSLSLHIDDRRESTFNAPAGATLTSGVTYWLVFAAAPGSTYFVGNYIQIFVTSDDSEVQGTATVNHWSIGDTSRYNRATSTWETEQRVMSVAILGAQRPRPLVSNLRQTRGNRVEVGAVNKGAQAFVAGPGLAGFGYRLQGIMVNAVGAVDPDTFVVDIPEVRVSLHSDANGLPGSFLHNLTVPDDFSSTGVSTDYTLSAPPGTVLRAGAKYWVVFESSIHSVFLSTTSSPDEDQAPPPVDGWLIGDDRLAFSTSNVWVMLPRVVKLAVLGEPEWDASEPAGEDFPGAYFNGHETTGGVAVGTVSTGHLTAGVDTDDGLTGDFWYLDTGPGRSYRVEVTFGDDPDLSTGGFAGISFVDPDGVDYVSGCCESDHNREDGATFLHFSHSHQAREWNTRYMVKVAAFDLYNTDTAVYNGPYEITLTDITGVYQMVNAFSGGTSPEGTNGLLDPPDGNTVDFAFAFRTGAHSAGYTLDRIKVRFFEIAAGGAIPDIAIHMAATNAPGAKVCDLAVDRIVESQVSWATTPLHTFLAPDCAEDTLAANTAYWIVFTDVHRFVYELEVAQKSPSRDYYGSGWTLRGYAKRGALNIWAEDTDIVPRIGLWAKEFNNPLLVSLEVTSDPTKGTASDTYGAGDVITFEVKISEAVTVTGAPRLRFNIGSGSGDEYASYVSGSGSDTLVFAYTVLPTDADDNGIFLYNRSLSYPDPAADTIVAVDDNLPVIDNITGQRRTLSGHKVDGTITN